MVQRVFGLIGYPLGHSFSKVYFSEKFEREGIQDAAYELFPIAAVEELPALIAAHPTLRGLNVTIPYKEAVIPYLDELSPEAGAIGAVNCIRIGLDGKKTGYNTDATGFAKSLASISFLPGCSGIVLGNGGAAKAVGYVLRQLGMPYKLVSRKPGAETLTWLELEEYLRSNRFASFLIVNTTPLGMYPDTTACPPLPFELLGGQHFVYDLIYNPEETVLLRRARSLGCSVKNGLEMLHGQAEAAWQIWQV